MNHFIHRQILLPAFESGLKRRMTLKYWRGLESTQWLSATEIAELQLLALRNLLNHAYENCPYYRDQWDQRGLHPRKVQSLEDFRSWPVINREVIRQDRHQMRATTHSQSLIAKSTGGSSGVPLQFDLDHNSNDRRSAACHRGYGWANAAPGTKQLHLWGTSLTAQPCLFRVKERLYHSLHRRKVLSCFEPCEDLTTRVVATLASYRPDVIIAYTNPLYEVAREMERRGTHPSHTPQSIVVGAEKLHSFQRSLIERVFRAPVFETYGSREFMLIGAECERHQGLHLTSEQLLVEVLDDEGHPVSPGVEGNVVITDLYNYGMPFIRYANGDRAVGGWSACRCGRGLPLMKTVVGRQLDVLQGSDGRMIPGEFFPHLVKDFAAVRRFQVIQEEPGHVRFRLSAEGLSAQDDKRLQQLVRGAFGEGVRVDFEPVNDIPLTAAGKLQVVINRIGSRKAA